MFILLALSNMPWASSLSNSNAPQYAIGGLTCAIILVSLVGNFLVLFAVARSKILQRMNTAWYVSLAIADLGKAIICMPIFVALLLDPKWSLSENMCPVYHCFQMSFELVSILNLTAISLDRVFMITRPLTYHRTVNFTKIMACICSLWILSFLLSFLQLLWWKDGSDASPQWKYDLMVKLGLAQLGCTYKPPLVMAIIDFVIAFVIPMIIMAISYTKIFLVVHSQMRRLKKRPSDVANDDVSDPDPDPDPDQYSQIPAITKSVDALRANTSEERLRYSTGPLPSRSSFAIAPSELARITEVLHENCSSPSSCKECSARSRTATDDSSKSKLDAQSSLPLKQEGDLNVIDLTQDNVQVNETVSTNSNNNAKSSNTKMKTSKSSDELAANITAGKDIPSTESQPAQRRSSLKKAQRDSIVSTKRVSVQFQLYPEDQQDTETQEQTASELQAQAQPAATKARKSKPNIVLEDDTTTSEAVTTSTWLSGSSGERPRVARQPSEEHMQAWASRHFSDGAQDLSFSSGTRASVAESTGSFQAWNSMIQRRRKSLQRIRENKAVRMTFVVIGAFVFCWLPFEVIFLIRQFCVDCVNDTTWHAATMIAYSASAINPFIYNFYSREFRRALKRALCCDDNVVAPWL